MIFNENIKIGIDIFNKCLSFAKNMTNGKGEHSSKSFGSGFRRNNSSIFRDTLQGKIAELAVIKYIKDNTGLKPDISTLNTIFKVEKLGWWEDCDLIYSDKKISIKSTKDYGTRLLLEKHRYDIDGSYKDSDTNIKHDIIFLVRIKGINDLNVSYSDIGIEISGFISNNIFVKKISKNDYIPAKTLIGKIPLKVDNYCFNVKELIKPEKISDYL